MHAISSASPSHVRIIKTGELCNVVAWGVDSDGDLFALIIRDGDFERIYGGYNSGVAFHDGPAA